MARKPTAKPNPRPAPGAKNDDGSIFKGRLSRLRAELRARDLETAVITDPYDVGYLTGFLGGDSILVISAGGRGKPTLISDGRYETELEPFHGLVSVVMRTGGFAEAVADALGGKPTGPVGVQSEAITLDELAGYHKALGKKMVTPTSGLTHRLRLIKDEHEVRAIQKAIDVQQDALAAILLDLKPGQRENEVAARLEMEMKSRGASRPGFDSIVATGANAALPHYRPTRTKITKSGVLLIDWGAVVDGYNSDMTRVFAFGKWPGEMARVYDIVLEALQAAADAVQPGRTSREIDQVARDVITKAGYGERFNHGLGHGFGLKNKEDPRLNPLYEPMPLEPGMVFTIEPGIYLPGVGGVRLENDYLVTERGAKDLCHMPLERRWATL